MPIQPTMVGWCGDKCALGDLCLTPYLTLCTMIDLNGFAKWPFGIIWLVHIQ